MKLFLKDKIFSVSAITPERDDDDDDVILIEREIPFIDLCTPNVRTNSSQNRRLVENELVDQLMKLVQTSTEAKIPDVATNSSQNGRLVENGEESLQDFLDPLMKRDQTSTVAETPSIVYDNGSQNPPVMCTICLRSAIGRKPHATHCGHVFCEYCIKRSMVAKKQCPTCKKIVVSVSPLYI